MDPYETQEQNTQEGLPGTESRLVKFANALDQTVNLARKKRNAAALGLMQSHQGTVMASDFTSVLNSMNKASDSYVTDVLENVLPEDKAKKSLTSGALTYSQADIDEGFDILKTGKSPDGANLGNPMGADGFVDPNVYIKLLDQWRANSGVIEDFVKQYPLSLINPSNTWIGKHLQERGIKWTDQAGQGDFTDTEKRKLEQKFGTDWNSQPRQTLLDYLYGEDDYDL